MATSFPLPFVPGAPEGNNIKSSPQTVTPQSTNTTTSNSGTSSTTVASEWQQAKTNLESQYDQLQSKVDAKQAAANDAIATANSLRNQRNELGKQLDAAGKSRSSDPAYQALVNKIDSSQQESEKLLNEKNQLVQQQVEVDAQIFKAERQIAVAESSPTGTIQNSTPANSNPGPNTESETYGNVNIPEENSSTIGSDSAPEISRTEQTVGENGGIIGGQRISSEPAALADNSQGLPVLAEDGSVAQGIATNPETGETYYTSPPELAENTQGLPVLAEDGSVAQGVAINPETGETYYTEPPPLTENLDGIPVLAEDGSVAQGVAINPETGETYYTGQQNPSVETGVQEARTSQSVTLNPVQITGRIAPDARVRLQLAKGSKYLYNASNPGILKPLLDTNGVIFPYTPQIQISYQATYESTDIVHSNYKTFNYKNSSISDVTINAKFTAQDQKEAEYLLAVIHFFRSVTKMFYGLDKNPIAGTPPPLCYLTGYGTYMFDELPLVVSVFQLNLPQDVDYINASPVVSRDPGLAPYSPPMSNQGSSFYRLRSAGLQPGAVPAPPSFSQNNDNDVNTRVPTIMDINITCHPIITRKDMSNKFSLQEYASGNLLRSNSNGLGRGIW